MPSLNDYIDFTVTLDFATGNISVTDTSPYPVGVAEEITGILRITQPDGIAVQGVWVTPDISWNGTELPPALKELRTTAQNTPQCGTYTIKYIVNHPDYTTGELTKEFILNITYPEIDIEDEFDVFTPLLQLVDLTDYQLSGFDAPAITRDWTIAVGGITTIVSSAAAVDLAYLGNYYDAVYTVDFTGTGTQAHTTYAYLTVIYPLTTSLIFYANTPPAINDLVQCLTTLKQLLDAQADVNCCTSLETTYGKAERRLSHFIHMLRVGETEGAFDLLEDFLHLTACTHGTNRNNPIQPYDLSPYTGGGGSDGDYFNYFLPSDLTEVELPALNGKIIKAIDMDGFGRVFSIGNDGDIAVDGRFVVVNATPKKFIYGGTMSEGQWLRIKYTNS